MKQATVAGESTVEPEVPMPINPAEVPTSVVHGSNEHHEEDLENNPDLIHKS